MGKAPLSASSTVFGWLSVAFARWQGACGAAADRVSVAREGVGQRLSGRVSLSMTRLEIASNRAIEAR